MSSELNKIYLSEGYKVADQKGVNVFENTETKTGMVAKIVFAFHSFTEFLAQKYDMLKDKVEFLFFGKTFEEENIDFDIEYQLPINNQTISYLNTLDHPIGAQISSIDIAKVLEIAKFEVGKNLNKTCAWKLRDNSDLFVLPVTTNIMEACKSDAIVVFDKNFELGAGGMGTVYAGWLFDHQSDGQWSIRNVAVKVGKKPGNLLAGELQLTEHNAEKSAFMETPALAFGYATVDGHECLVKELCSGDADVHDFKSIDELALALLTSAKGLYKLHARGIAHRDIKPQNLLIDTRGFAKIADFDFAGDENELVNYIVGTQGFTNNAEIIKSCVQDAAGDMYAFGLTIGILSIRKQNGSDATRETIEQLWNLKEELLKPKDERLKAYQVAYRLADLVPTEIRNRVAATA
ncbi:MAG: protein kinase [Chlamydiales bacterium]|nr:protein kinase [Chlamydiales bacterium]